MFLTRRFFLALALCILVIAGGYWWAPLFSLGRGLLLLLLIVTVVECVLLWSSKSIEASRHCSSRFSNGDDNEVRVSVLSNYPFGISVAIIDEAPVQFQQRDIWFTLRLRPNEGKSVTYRLRPTRRGSYSFGVIRVFVSTPLQLVRRRYSLGSPVDVKVYPSFLMLRRYELLAINNRLTEFGIKKVRRAGHGMEFEQIRDYVEGDDYRQINWTATARRAQVMVNVWQAERSQQVFSVIDMGRVMQQSWKGMTLLDYAINASLMLSFAAIHKDDKAGLATFNERFRTFVPASRQPGQMQVILDSLYAQQTSFLETDFSALAVGLNRHVDKRSLLVLFTNFTGMKSMQRQLAYLRQLNTRNRLLVVFFEDVEVKDFIQKQPVTTEEYYQSVMAAHYVAGQHAIVEALRQQGILSIITTPDNLTVDVVNKYLDMKARQLLG